MWLNTPCQELFAKDCTSKSPNVLTADDFQRETPADATDPFGQLLTLEVGLNRTYRAPERKTCFFSRQFSSVLARKDLRTLRVRQTLS